MLLPEEVVGRAHSPDGIAAAPAAGKQPQPQASLPSSDPLLGPAAPVVGAPESAPPPPLQGAASISLEFWPESVCYPESGGEGVAPEVSLVGRRSERVRD